MNKNYKNNVDIDDMTRDIKNFIEFNTWQVKEQYTTYSHETIKKIHKMLISSRPYPNTTHYSCSYRLKLFMQNLEETYNNGTLNFYAGLIINKKFNNIEKAIPYYLKAIEYNHVNAMFVLGYLYNSLHDYENVKKYYSMAAENKHVESMYLLCKLFLELNDYKNAFTYCKMAIDHKHIMALHTILNMYMYQKDIENVKKYFEIISKLPNIPKNNQIGAVIILDKIFSKKELYLFLIGLSTKNTVINEKIIELEKTTEIQTLIKILDNTNVCLHGTCNDCNNDNIKLYDNKCMNCYIKI